MFDGVGVLITGGGTGTGAAMARAFQGFGARVVIAGRRLDVLEKVHGVQAVQADVTDEASVAAMFAAAGPCQIVIANAGSGESAPLQRTDMDLWNRMIAVNLTGSYLTFRDGLRQMGPGGRLIAVASIAGLKGAPYISAYAAAKHGVVGLVRSVALEVAAKGITCNAICPGYLDTAMTDDVIANIMVKTGKSEAEAAASLTATNPQGRLIAPDEVAAMAVWLASDGARGVNGQALAITGGEA